MADPVEELAQRLFDIFRRQEVLLFAGAGVGRRAGLPDWSDYLGHLVSVAATYEEETAALMRKRVAQGSLPEAAHIYKTCPVIPEGEKWRNLVLPFARETYRIAELDHLLALPFKAIVTTNYDLSLADAATSRLRRMPRLLELHDSTLRQGSYLDEFYVARIHGRAEVPTSLVLDTDDFARVATNADYIDFLLHVLRHRSCLFLGFSFEDPAIKKVLDTFAERSGPDFPRLHTGVVPADARALRDRLERYNIAVLTYPPNQHDLLWKAISSAAKLLTADHVPPAPPRRRRPFETMRRFLATSYARLKLTEEIEPLRNLVTEGVVLSLLTEATTPLDRGAIAAALRNVFALTEDSARAVVVRAVDRLLEREICIEQNGLLTVSRPLAGVLETQLDVLLSGALSRLTVREGIRKPEQYRQVLKTVLEEILLERGWDAGAHFAAARTADDFDLFAVTQEALARHLPRDLKSRQDQLARAVYQLVAHPDEREAVILIDLGRLAFGIDLVLERPHSAILWQTTLPHRIYLDTSVLLPLIVPAHPATGAYVTSFDKLREATESIGLDLRLFVAQQFLNEVVSHRRISRQLVAEYGLEEPRRLSEYVGLGMGGENVFVVSYAARMREQRLSYEDFLHDVAPYETEDSLDRFLRDHGIQALNLKPVREGERRVHEELHRTLRTSYTSHADWQRMQKPDILIDHEALQLWQLDFDAREGLRSLFVTADARLRRLLLTGQLARLGGLVLSPLNVIQLVDLLVGLRPEGRSLARVLWAMPELPEIHALREYFVDRGLEYYFGEAHAQGVPELIQAVDQLTREAEELAEREKLSFRPARAGEQKKALSVLDTFQDRFYERMAKEISRRDRGE